MLFCAKFYVEFFMNAIVSLPICEEDEAYPHDMLVA